MKMRNYIQSFICVMALAGIFLSTSHYHNEVMECLIHADEQHISENNLLCPVCALVSDVPESAPLPQSPLLISLNINFALSKADFSFSPSLHQLRAPPVLA